MADSKRIGPYRIIQRLGAGGMGEVVLAHDDRLDRLVAIKRLHDPAAMPERRERFRREARIVARLNHPAIVQIHDVLRLGDQDFLIMEYVEGQTLRARCDAGPMTVSEVLGIGHQIALGMAAAHDLGIIHRDLKAENVLITPAGRAKLTDFGIAKLDGEVTVTARGAVVGTFRAMSPEQALGHPIDHRSDLFSFGVLLYEALTGESPFRADTPFLTVQRLVNDDPRPVAELVPSIPDGLASLVHQLLAKEPLLRPRDFHEVADALIELAGQTCDAPCRASSSLDGLPRSGEDGRSTEDGRSIEDDAAPARSRRDADKRSPEAVPATARGTPYRRSWRAASLGIVALGALCLGYALRGGSGAATGASIVRVAVLAPDVSGADGRPDVALFVAAAVRNAVETSVRALAGLDLVPRGDVESYFDGVTRNAGHRLTQREIRAAVGADETLAIHLACLPDSCQVTLQRYANAPGGPTLESFKLPADSVGHLDETIGVYLSKLYPNHPLRSAATGSIDPRDHERYIRLVHAYWAGSGAGASAASSDDVLAEIERIRARSPGSIDVLLFEAEVLRHRSVQTANSAQAERALALLHDADELFPDNYGILSAQFDLVLSTRRLDKADALLDRLVTLDPDSSATHLQRAKLHFQRGELDRARGELAAAARRDSFSWRVLYYRARVSRELGDRADTQAAIDQLLARSPDNYAGLSLRALTELDAGRLACAEQLYAKLVSREPLYDECLNLGNTQNKLHQYREAMASLHCALRIRPDDLAARLDLAEAQLLDGDAADAANAVEQLHALLDLLARKRRDAPGKALQGSDRLVEAQTLAYLGRDDQSLAAAARARVAELVRPAARPAASALYTAALVHAVLGDRDLATRYVTQYLDAGNSPADLGYRWFDDLWPDPVLDPRLAAPAHACEASSAPWASSPGSPIRGGSR